MKIFSPLVLVICTQRVAPHGDKTDCTCVVPDVCFPFQVKFGMGVHVSLTGECSAWPLLLRYKPPTKLQ